ncbi:MAG: hypothetical protein QM744_10470 [Mesorhizobium sp.]
MAQTFLVERICDVTRRFRAWVIALSETPTVPAAHEVRSTDKRDPDDLFYLSLGMNGYW